MSQIFIGFDEVELITSTAKAGLFLIEGEEHWIPWSQVRDDSVDTDGAIGSLFITEWIAKERDLV